jgi:hypothetical protein
MADMVVGRDYGTGLNMGRNNAREGEKGPRLEKSGCIFWGVTGHKTKRSKSCKYYGWAKSKVEAEMVSLNVVKATGLAVLGVARDHYRSSRRCHFNDWSRN